MASNAIKGITIEIGGDTTKLGKAIGDSEKKTRSLQAELKQIEKLLKLDPTNVELLAQKQTVLTESVEETKKKLDTLKEAEKQVIEQFEKGEVSEEQVRALQREILQTEKALEDMQEELKTATRNLNEFGDNNGVAKEKAEKLEKEIREQNKALEAEKDALEKAEKAQKDHEKAVEKAKEELSDFKEKASEAFDAVKTGALALGTATVALGGYALKVTDDFDKAFNTLITKTGASTEEMDALSEAMENVYANNFGESIEDVAESMATIKTATNATGKELETITEQALLMRDTFGFEVNESIRAVNSLMDQFGITAEEAYSLIAQGAQNGLNQNDDLMDVINEYSVQFQDMGYTAEDMFNMLANGVDAGTWSVDKLGDAVKEFNIRMSDGSAKDAVEALGFSWESVSESWSKGGDEAKEVFNMLFTELDGLENTTEGYGIGVGLIGTMYEDLGQDAILALSKTEGEISKTSDALAEINSQKYDNIGSAIQGLGRTLETDVIVPLGEELMPVVEDVIGYVQNNAPEIKAVLATVVEKVGEFVGFVVNNGATILSVITGIGAGMIAWNVATMISSVVGAIKAYQLANEGATVAQALFNAVMNANPMVLLVSIILAVIVAIATFIATNEEARAKFTEIWNKVKEVFAQAWEAIKEVWDAVKPYFEQIWEKIKEIFAVVKPILLQYWSLAWEAIKLVWSAVSGYFQNVWNTIKGIFAVVKAVLSGNWKDAWEAIKGIVKGWTGYFSDIWEKIKHLFAGVKDFFGNIFGGAWEKVKGVFAGWGDFFGGLWNTIKEKFSSLGTSISEAISGAVKTGINTVISLIEMRINTAIRLINGAIGLINKIPGVELGKIAEVEFPRLAKGGIVDRSTFAEIGEDGAEAVIPLERNTEWMRLVARGLSNHLKGESIGSNNTAVLNKLDGIYERLNNLQIVLDTGILVGEAIDKIDAGLANKQLLTARGV